MELGAIRRYLGGPVSDGALLRGMPRWGILAIAAFIVLVVSIPAEREKPAPPVVATVAVTAVDLAKAYAANEAAAQAAYANRPIMVSGVVASITLDYADDPQIDLEAGPVYARASLTDAEKPKATELAKGEAVALVCTDVTEVLGSPILHDCRIDPAT
ncbi:hypothetical protein BH09PSE4_BH09PSE4_13790 [soil metagenome]